MASAYVLILIVVVGYLLYARFARGSAIAAANATYADMLARDVASRLGLQVVEGSPEQNLMMLHHTHVTTDMEQRRDGGLLGTNVEGKSSGVRLEGMPHGRRQTFVYALDSELERQNVVGGGTYTRALRFALTTEVKATFPEFEVVLRAPNAALRPTQAFALPAQQTGLPAIDAALLVTTNDPAFARVLGPLLAPLTGHTYVHLVGRDQRLELLANHATSSYATYFLEDNAKVHHAIADAIERSSAR